VVDVELFSTLLYVTFHLYPLGRPDSVNVVVHVVDIENPTEAVMPAAIGLAGEEEGV
jgi:hypothetical protein